MPRRYNSQETVEMILSASMKLFSEKGFDKTSMQEIVDESGVSKGSIFHHFNSKEEILTTVIVNQAKAQDQIIHTWLDEIEGMTGKEKMIALLDKVFKDTHTDASFEDMDTDALNVQILRSPQMILAIMQESLKIVAPTYTKIFKEGMEDGSITTTLPDQCAEALVLLMNYWCNSIIFECDVEHLAKRMLLVQQMMKQLGADVITDKHVSQLTKIFESLNNEKKS
ncbi:MAG: TetR/AcrR family transcriptional regulator [Defluviitaleaceae bacterium]|nr:TetR/AcrR family transcriptional regulator [Defluviitaleaceae bacterium]